MIIRKFGGRYLVNTKKVISLSGNWKPQKIVMLEFDTMKQLNNCFQSDEYKAIATLRERSTTGRAVAVEGANP